MDVNVSFKVIIHVVSWNITVLTQRHAHLSQTFFHALTLKSKATAGMMTMATAGMSVFARLFEPSNSDFFRHFP